MLGYSIQTLVSESSLRLERTDPYHYNAKLVQTEVRSKILPLFIMLEIDILGPTLMKYIINSSLTCSHSSGISVKLLGVNCKEKLSQSRFPISM